MKTRVSHFSRTILIILVLISLKTSVAQYISHLGGGGEWTDGNTWIGGFAPGPGDNVVINGTVQVDISISCTNITINNTGTLMNKNNGNKTLTVLGNITNYGTIQDNYYSLYLDIHGNVHQEATWNNQKTNLVNTTNQDVWCTSPFTGANFSSTQAGNTISITSNILSFVGCKVDMGDANLVFGNGTLSVIGDYFKNAIINSDQLDVTVNVGAYLQSVTFNTNYAWLRGIVTIMNNIVFNDNVNNVVVEVVDTLQNRNSSNYTLTVNGDLHNNGLIRNNYYSLYLNITGSLVNDGVWANQITNLTGNTNQYLTFYKPFDGVQFNSLMADQTMAIGTTALRFNGTTIDFNGDTLQMTAGNDSLFINGGHLKEMTIQAGGPPWQIYCHQSNAAWYDDVFIEANEVVLDGVFQFATTFNITGNTRVEGVLQNRSSTNQTANIFGDLTNNGTIQDNYYSLYLNITGDIFQNGSWTNLRTNLSGDMDQNLNFTQAFEGEYFENTNIIGKIISNSNLTFTNTKIDFNNDTLMFAAAADNLEIESQYFQQGVIIKEGSKTTGQFNCTLTNSAYLNDMNIVADNMSLDGTFQYISPMSFIGNVTVAGILQNRSSNSYTATITGNLTNNGIIQDNYYNCTLNITGDLFQNGIWTNNTTNLIGDNDQNLNFSQNFEGEYFTNVNITGKVISNSNLTFVDTRINFNNDTLVFAAAADNLIIESQYFQHGVIIKEASKTAGQFNCTLSNNAYLSNMSIVAENINLGGIFQYISPMSFYGHVTVTGTFQNRSSNSYSAYFYGNVTNNGIIQSNNYNNTLYITGDIFQNGVWSNYYTYLSGDAEQSINQTQAFSCNKFVDTDPASAIQGTSDLTFLNTDVDLGGATLVMKDYSILSILDAWFINTTILSNTFDLFMSGNGSYLQSITANNVSILGTVQVRSACVFSGNTTVEGILQNHSSNHYTLNIDGNIQNNGFISDNYYNLYMYVDGDIGNKGTWANEWTQLNGYSGSVNQTIDIQNGEAITGQIRLFPNSASTYTWHWNGNPLGAHPDFTGEISQILNFSTPVSATWAGTFNCLTNLGWSRNIYVTTNTVTVPEIDITVLLEGPFNGSTMNTNLNSSGILPIAQPYNTSPFNYWGPETVVSIPNANVVDWVYIELRDAVDAASAIESTRIDRQAGFLLNDGSIVGLDGTSHIFFAGTLTNNLFIIIHQRNHLDIMSASALTESAGIYAYDFTSSASQAHGSGLNDLGGGLYGMIGGDANGDGIINDNDGIDTWIPQVGNIGYLQGDGNFDGQVDNKDKNDIWFSNFGKSEQLP